MNFATKICVSDAAREDGRGGKGKGESTSNHQLDIKVSDIYVGGEGLAIYCENDCGLCVITLSLSLWSTMCAVGELSLSPLIFRKNEITTPRCLREQ